jgi:hypothetical protein
MDLTADTCNPQAALKFHNYKFYSLILPALLMFLVLEVVFVFMAIPTSIGSALAAAGPFPTSKVPLVPKS